MENNEMICEEMMDSAVDVIDLEPSDSKFGAGKTMLIVAAVTAGVALAVKLGKMAWEKHKAKKELRLVDKNDTVEVTEEDLAEITK